MPDARYPGVYLQEGQMGHTIDGVATSTTAFVGRAPDGPVDTPVRITSMGELERAFGRPGIDDALTTSVGLFFANGGREAIVVRPSGAAVPASDDGTGIHAFGADHPFNLLCLPGLASDLGGDVAAIAGAMATASAACETRRAMLLVDPLPAWREIGDVVAGPVSIDALSAGVRRANAAVYFPELMVPNARGVDQVIGPSGAVAGVLARTDLARGVWHVAAGREAGITAIRQPASTLTDSEVATLSDHGVNAIRVLPGAGAVVWGAQTLDGGAGADPEWKYVPVRRLALFIEASIERGTQWAVFEPNDEPLWTALRASIDNFLVGLWKQGAFRGRTPPEAWFVKCGPDTTTQQELDSGVVQMLVGFAPLKPAEFVILHIRLMTGGNAERPRPQQQRRGRARRPS